jgi:hypothetical protein
MLAGSTMSTFAESHENIFRINKREGQALRTRRRSNGRRPYLLARRQCPMSLTDRYGVEPGQDFPSPLRGSVALGADRDAAASLRLRVNLLSSQL